MQTTTNYNLLLPEGTDIVNPLTQVNPNFSAIDSAMFANKQSSIGMATEVVTGAVHAIVRSNTDSDVFRFTATGAWTAGDSMTVDGVGVTVHLSDGTTPATGSYIIGAEVLAIINGTLVTLAISSTPPAQGVTSFNSRTGAVVPAVSDYDASMIDYDNTGSGLTATDVQSAIDEIVGSIGGYRVVATAAANNTYHDQLVALATAYSALSDPEKLSCKIIQGSLGYNNNGTGGEFNYLTIGASSAISYDLNITNATFRKAEFTSGGTTVTDLSSTNDTLALVLVIV